MHTLVLFAHPDPASLTATTARRIADGIIQEGGTVEIVDLASEGFDPRFTDADLQLVRGSGAVPDDVRREQERVERADSVVLVHPVYWWSMPSLLQGWLDRVFTFGWAFGTDDATAIRERDMHLLRIGGNAPSTYEEHGYAEAIRTSIEHGIFDFVGGPVASSRAIHSAADGALDERVTETINAVVQDVIARERTLASA